MSKSGHIYLHIQKQFKPRSRLPESNAVITPVQLFPQNGAKFSQLNFGITHQIHKVFQGLHTKSKKRGLRIFSLYIGFMTV